MNRESEIALMRVNVVLNAPIMHRIVAVFSRPFKLLCVRTCWNIRSILWLRRVIPWPNPPAKISEDKKNTEMNAKC